MPDIFIRLGDIFIPKVLIVFFYYLPEMAIVLAKNCDIYGLVLQDFS
jgi:hypothetical protein